MTAERPSSPEQLGAARQRLPNPFCDSALRNAHEQLRADVPTVQAEVFAALSATIARVRTEGRSRMQLVLGQPGQGKTHLLARLRRLAEASWSDPTAAPLALGVIAPVRDPLRPFRHILRELGASLGRPLLRRDPGAAEDDPQPDSQLERLGYLTLARGIAHLAQGDPTLADWGHERVPRYLASFALRVREEWPERGEEISRRLLPWAEEEQIAPELLRAICRLPVAGAAAAALSWMKGSLLPEADLLHYRLPEPIDDEDLAFRVLVSLSRGAGVPLVLGFDQIEGVRRQGEDAVRQLFAALSELFNQDGRLVLLGFCQLMVWTELRLIIEQQIQDRMEVSLKLRHLEAAEALELCAARLLPAWRGAGLTAPHPTYPFTEAEIRAEHQAGQMATPRAVFKYLERRWDDGPELSAQPPGPAPDTAAAPPPPPPPPPRPTPRAVYDELIGRERQALPTRSPEVRAAAVRNAVQRALDAARLEGTEVHGARVVRVAAGAAARGQDAPLAITLSRAGVEQQVYLDASNSAHGKGAAATVRRLQQALQRDEGAVGLLLREAGCPLPPLATQLIQRTPRGALVVLRDEELPPLCALEAFLNAAADNDIAQAESQRLCAALAAELSAVDRVVAEAFAPVAARAEARAAADPELVRRLLEYLAERRSVVEEARLCDALGVSAQQLAAAVDALVAQGQAVVMMDGNQARTIVSRPTGDRAEARGSDDGRRASR